ncbi:MAG TPA: pyridoxamine 5'-phosphate oxidase [Haliangiales bacterium]|nr:pyridoxamine 5'-phosphate oxidase [Haliangiales bacterium]
MSHDDPISRFQDAFDRARAASTSDPTAAALATADESGAPSVRMVLLKHADERGFVFYTNRTSRKGAEIDKNPRAALCFYWPELGEQVRVEGTIEQVSDAESDAYFKTRPRESQLGAWASRQSRQLESRDILLERFQDLGEEYDGKPIPRPPWWGGYRVRPRRIEFWRHGDYRLHERELYVRGEGGWLHVLLNP